MTRRFLTVQMAADMLLDEIRRHPHGMSTDEISEFARDNGFHGAMRQHAVQWLLDSGEVCLGPNFEFAIKALNR